MIFKPATWLWIALGLTALNLVGLGWAAALEEGPHAGAHVALSVLCGWWAWKLRRAPTLASPDAPDAIDQQERFEALESDVTRMRQELTEAQERVDFAERMLAQRPAAPRGDQR